MVLSVAKALPGPRAVYFDKPQSMPLRRHISRALPLSIFCAPFRGFTRFYLVFGVAVRFGCTVNMSDPVNKTAVVVRGRRALHQFVHRLDTCCHDPSGRSIQHELAAVHGRRHATHTDHFQLDFP